MTKDEELRMRVCHICNRPVSEEEWYGECECCWKKIGPCCLSDLDDPPYCTPCELKTREPEDE